MSSPGVSSIVRDILAIFTDGLNILTKPKGNKQKRHKKVSKLSQDELNLHDSLVNRPKEIEAEYSQSVVKHGNRFEKGDHKAYSDLAQTLLILNTGLINFINQNLSSNATDVSRSRQNLLSLSESAASSTKRALSQLDLRLSIPPKIDLKSTSDETNQNLTKRPHKHRQTARPGPSPLLARGGWVRSKSGSSVVSAATARKLAAQNVRHQRTKSTPIRLPANTTFESTTTLGRSTLNDQLQNNGYSYQSLPEVSSREWKTAAREKSALPDFERAPSMLVIPGSYFDGQYIQESEDCPPPPRPPKIPLHVRAKPSTRARPISTATFLTASTKIGEIPEHRWPDRVLSEEEQEQLPLPYVIPPPLQPVKQKSRGFRFWRKAEAR